MKKLYNVVLVSSCFLQLSASHVFGGGNLSKAKTPTTYQIGTQPQNPSTNTTEIPQVMQLTEDELKACTKESLARIILDTTKSNQWDKIACLYIKKISQDENYENFNLEEICDAMECVEKLKENVSNSSIKNKLENLLPQLEACAGGSARLNTYNPKIKIEYKDYNDYLKRQDIPSNEKLFKHYPFFVRNLTKEEKEIIETEAKEKNEKINILPLIECPCVKKFSLSEIPWLYKNIQEKLQISYCITSKEIQFLQCFYFLSLEDNPHIIKIASDQYKFNDLNAQIQAQIQENTQDNAQDVQPETNPEPKDTINSNTCNEFNEGTNTTAAPLMCILNDKYSVLGGSLSLKETLKKQQNDALTAFIGGILQANQSEYFSQDNKPNEILKIFKDYTEEQILALPTSSSNSLQNSTCHSLTYKANHQLSLKTKTLQSTQKQDTIEENQKIQEDIRNRCKKNRITASTILKSMPLDKTPKRLLQSRQQLETLSKSKNFITEIKEQNLDLTDCIIGAGDLKQARENGTLQGDCTTQFFKKNKIFFTIYPEDERNHQEYVIFTVLYVFKTNALLKKFLENHEEFKSKTQIYMDTNFTECFISSDNLILNLKEKATNFENLKSKLKVALGSISDHKISVLKNSYGKYIDEGALFTKEYTELYNTHYDKYKLQASKLQDIKYYDDNTINEIKNLITILNKNAEAFDPLITKIEQEKQRRQQELKAFNQQIEKAKNELSTQTSDANISQLINNLSTLTSDFEVDDQNFDKTLEEAKEKFKTQENDIKANIEKIKQQKAKEEQEAKAKQARLEEAAKKEKKEQARLLKEQEEQKRLEEQKRKEEAERKQREEQEKVKAEQERLAKEKKQKEEQQSIIATRQQNLNHFEQQIEKAKNELNTLVTDAKISDTSINDSISRLSTLASDLKVNDQSFDKNLEKAQKDLDKEEKNSKVNVIGNRIKELKQQKEQEEQKRLEEQKRKEEAERKQREEQKAKAKQARLEAKNKTAPSSTSVTPATALQTPATSSTSSSEQWVTAAEIVTYFESIGKKNYSMYLKSDKYDIKNPKTGYKMLDDLIKQQFRK